MSQPRVEAATPGGGRSTPSSEKDLSFAVDPAARGQEVSVKHLTKTKPDAARLWEVRVSQLTLRLVAHPRTICPGARPHLNTSELGHWGKLWQDPIQAASACPGQGEGAPGNLVALGQRQLCLVLSAQVKHLELQLEDCEQRWQRRFEDAKRQEDAGHARMELQCRYLEAELDRCKEVHASEMRHFQEQKRLLVQSHTTEVEDARREERRKAQAEIEKVKSDCRLELEEQQRKHERSVSIVKQQSDIEAESLRRAHTGEHHLTKLVEQVQGSVAEVERLSKRVDTDKSLEWSVRERQLEAREKNARELEAQLTRQSKEVEQQRRRLPWPEVLRGDTY
ncbi:gnl [Symbiodinium natans]|uniref:Gnl protein n=1 Tax=Symbiodinium natans TaxID=878477 RepID=A0A812V4V2_9DINO|nr:gnl [Symbiodinium natans]